MLSLCNCNSFTLFSTSNNFCFFSSNSSFSKCSTSLSVSNSHFFANQPNVKIIIAITITAIIISASEDDLFFSSHFHFLYYPAIPFTNTFTYSFILKIILSPISLAFKTLGLSPKQFNTSSRNGSCPLKM